MKMKGTVKGQQKNKKGQIVGFHIEVEDDGITKTYYAHLGDLKENEDLLYKDKNILILTEGDEVEFDPWEPNKDRAIRVEKIDRSPTD